MQHHHARSSEAASGILALALGEAQDGLEHLPLTEEVRWMQTRHAALRTVFTGIVQGRPKLTEAQRSRFMVDTLALARDVSRARARAGT
jgi:hypothetical protein